MPPTYPKLSIVPNPGIAPVPSNLTAHSTMPTRPNPLMGTKAVYPQASTPAPTTIPANQQQPEQTPISTGQWPNAYPSASTEPEIRDRSGLYESLIRSGVGALNQSAELTGNIAKAKQDVAGNPNYSLDTQVGRQGLIQQNIGTQATALAEQGKNYLSGASIVSPVQVPYTNQFLDPVSGESAQPFAANSSLNPISQISTLAADVVAGRKSPSTAQGLLGNNPSFNSMLNAEIAKLNPNFNFQQAETNAQTSGTLAPSVQNATKVLNTLQGALSNAPWWQNTGVPMINQLGTLFSKTTGIGLQGTRELAVAAGDARNAVSNALGSAYNTTPTAFDAYVATLIPDNPTPQDIQGAINQLSGLFGIRTDIYSQPGNVPQYNQGGGSGGWF